MNYIAKLHARLLAAFADNERGSVSLEQIFITVGLVALALLVVGGITAAVNSRLGSLV